MARMVRHAEFCERIIGPDGTYPALGRSVTYRSAAFQSLADVALREKLPVHLKPAQVRCALTAVHRNLYEGNQNFDENGWLVWDSMVTNPRLLMVILLLAVFIWQL